MRRANFVGTKFGGGGKRGRAKIPSPQPPSFLPARAFSLAREARRQFRSKKVRISSNKRTQRDQMGMREPRMAARQAHHAVDSGKTQSVYSAVRSSSRLFLR